MKPLRSILAAGLALAVLSTPAWAVTFQVVADTAGSPVTKKIAKAAGLATTLPVSKTSNAYFSFDVGGSGIDPNAVTGARLVIFFPKVTKPGNLTLFANASGFTEIFTPPATTIPTPTPGATIVASIPVVVADSKNFLTIETNVTAQVKAWLTAPASDFGFGISADSPTSLVNATIGSKEGSGSGYPAVLEVDVNDGGTGNVAGTNATFSGTVAGANATFTGNVGIGTTTPGAPLEIDGSNGTQEIISESTNNFAGLLEQNLQHAFFVGIDGASDRWEVFDASQNLTRLSVTFDGNVGIGTTTPGALLEVNGTAKFDSTTTFNNSITQNLSGGNFSFISTNGTAAGNAQLNFGIGSSPSNFGIIDNTNGPLEFETGGSFKMTILANGKVGIGVTNPTSTSLLEVNGGIKCIGAVDISSDARFKMHIAPLAGALAQTLRLRGVSYDWNRAKFPDKGFNDRHQLGFIAQEVREILPDVVSEDQDGYLSIGYTAIIPVLAEAVKELKQQKDAEIAALKADNAALAQKLTALEARDAAREARLTKLESALDERPAHAVTAALEFK